MGRWNHRVVKSSGDWGEWYVICECFYDNDGALHSHTAEGTVAGGESVEEVREVLERMISATYAPVVDEIKSEDEEVNEQFELDFAKVFGEGAKEIDVISTLEQENRQLRARNERLERFASQVENIVNSNKN